MLLNIKYWNTKKLVIDIGVHMGMDAADHTVLPSVEWYLVDVYLRPHSVESGTVQTDSIHTYRHIEVCLLFRLNLVINGRGRVVRVHFFNK